MHAYVNGSWHQGFLDRSPNSEQTTVVIGRQLALEPASNQFFVLERRVAMLASYLRALGVRRVIRKVRSRQKESARNDAWMSVGVGVVDDGEFERSPAAFVLPSGPAGAERAVVHRDLLHLLPRENHPTIPPAHFVPQRSVDLGGLVGDPAAAELRALVGWSPEEGTSPSISEITWRTILELLEMPPSGFRLSEQMPVLSKPRYRTDSNVPADSEAPSGLTYQCFGFGQYAKTQVVPNLGARITLTRVHEIDPIQIGTIDSETAWSWDTHPRPRSDVAASNAVIATYHHTHAPIAVELLDGGARHVIVEKPLATTVDQLDALMEAIRRNPEAEVHAAFQRRYSPFNEYLVDDLGDEPISMSAAVYEVPLPERHWYRWPVVGNAIVSNGCHWIDHFLFLNDYCNVSRMHVEKLSTQIVMTLELENSASAVISLRHIGAPRLGVRDSCVFWAANTMATIEDGRRYSAEREFRFVRRERIHPYRAHERMYQEFARRMEQNSPGDDPHTIQVSTGSILRLAKLLDDLA